LDTQILDDEYLSVTPIVYPRVYDVSEILYQRHETRFELAVLVLESAISI